MKHAVGAVAAVVLTSVAWVAAVFAADARKSDTRRSGFDDMSPQVQAIQRDDAQNPGMLWVRDGEALWSRKPDAGPACVVCHGDAAKSMRGVAARYPAFDERLKRPLTLQQRINVCRVEHQKSTSLAAEGDALLGLEAYVAHQSRGLPLAPPADPRLDAFRERGERLFNQRIGQLDLSCVSCHDANAGQRLGGSVIPQAHPTGYPIYRLEWQGLGSLQRRLRGCLAGVRAEAFAFRAEELTELELYLVKRAGGMPVEAPGVRP